MSTHEYSREKADGFWNVRILMLAKEIKVAIPTKPVSLEAAGTAITATFDEDLTGGEITTLDTVVADHKIAEVDTYLLARVKAGCCEEFDIRTTKLRESGWEYPAASGDFYSLTTQAEMKLSKAHARSADGDFPYPFRLAKIDNSGILDLDDANDIDAAHKQMFEVLNTLVESGLVLKKQVIDATTVEDVLAVVDTR